MAVASVPRSRVFPWVGYFTRQYHPGMQIQPTSPATLVYQVHAVTTYVRWVPRATIQSSERWSPSTVVTASVLYHGSDILRAGGLAFQLHWLEFDVGFTGSITVPGIRITPST